jgi:hypothetical protein
MAAPMKAGLPPECVLSSGYVLRLVALDATTGAQVAGVQLSEVSFFVTDLVGNVEDAAPAPLLVPSDELV